MAQTQLELNALRSLSTIFTPSHFRPIVSTGDISQSRIKIRRHFPSVESTPLYKALKMVYGALEKNYRNEYVFKNAILQELLKNYSLAETRLLSEIRTGASVADFIFLNGETRIFEIKTDLDGLEKLDKQIEDYRRIAEKVFIVSGNKSLERIVSRYHGTKIGILTCGPKNCITRVKEAEFDSNHFCHERLFKLMRRPEYLSLLSKKIGYQATSPNTKLFRESLEAAKTIEIKEFQKLVRETLKGRVLKCPEKLLATSTPMPLKQLCHALDLSSLEYDTLFLALKSSI